MLREFRRTHNVQLGAVRKALDYASENLSIPRPLLSRRLLTDGAHVFVEQLGSLVNLSASGQLYFRSVLEAQLHHVAWDDRDLAYRLYPEISGLARSDAMPIIAIDPALSFGRAFVLSRGIATHVIVKRIDAGESPDELAEDYGLTASEVTAAVAFETQAA